MFFFFCFMNTFSRGNLFLPMEANVSLCDPTRTKLLVRTALGPPGLATAAKAHTHIHAQSKNLGKLEQQDPQTHKQTVIFCWGAAKFRKMSIVNTPWFCLHFIIWRPIQLQLNSRDSRRHNLSYSNKLMLVWTFTKSLYSLFHAVMLV